MKIIKNAIKITIVFSILFVITSCTTMADYNFTNINNSLLQDNYVEVYSELEKNSNLLYSKHDEVLKNLDKGLVSHYAGETTRSNLELSNAEKLIEEYEAISITQSISSMLTNDNVKDYAGDTYEDIYSNIFMALNYLKMDNFEDAFVEVRRFDNKLKTLTVKNQAKIESEKKKITEGVENIPTAELKFHNSAFARYLSMLMYRADGDSDNAEVDYKLLKNAFALQSNLYSFPVPESISDDIIVPKDMARLNIISFTGRSPTKIEEPLRLAIGNTYYKLALPIMKKIDSVITSSKVEVISKEDNSVIELPLEKLESIEDIAVETYKQQYALIFTKSLIRSIAKATTTSLLNNKARQSDSGALGASLGLLSLTSAIATEFSERADVRISRFFPATASVTGVNLKPGVYDIRIVYFNAQNNIIAERFFENTEIKTRKLNLTESFCLQ